MGKRNWFKIFSDRWLNGSIREISLPCRGAFIDLLAMANSKKFGTGDGIIKIPGDELNHGFSDEQIALVMNIQKEEWLDIKSNLIQTDRIVVRGNNIIEIKNWKKYQSEYKRQRFYRIMNKKMKQNQEVNIESYNQKLQPKVTTKSYKNFTPKNDENFEILTEASLQEISNGYDKKLQPKVTTKSYKKNLQKKGEFQGYNSDLQLEVTTNEECEENNEISSSYKNCASDDGVHVEGVCNINNLKLNNLEIKNNKEINKNNGDSFSYQSSLFSTCSNSNPEKKEDIVGVMMRYGGGYKGGGKEKKSVTLFPLPEDDQSRPESKGMVQSKGGGQVSQIKTNEMSEEEFMEFIKKKYYWVDIEKEFAKMDGWLITRPTRKKTRRFIINWLNKTLADKPIEERSNEDGKPPVDKIERRLWEAEQRRKRNLEKNSTKTPTENPATTTELP